MNNAKKWMILIAGVVIVVAIGAVGVTVGYLVGNKDSREEKSKAPTEAAADEETEYDAYITLGEYRGLAADYRVPDPASITDDTVTEEAKYRMEDFNQYQDISGRGVQEGDYINLDFVGKLNGETLEGMASEGEEIIVGEGNYVDDLEKGLVGLEIGKPTQIDVTFPKDYDEAALAGQDTVFTVTVNSIQEVSTQEMTDAFIKENMGFDTVSQWQESIQEELYQQEEATSQEQLYEDLVTKVMGNASLGKYPQEEYDQAYAEVEAEMQESADMFSMPLDEYLDFMFGESEITKQWVEERILENGVRALIIQKEAINVTDDEYEQMLSENYAALGVESEAELTEIYSKEELTSYFIDLKYKDFLIAEAQITELPADEYDQKYADDETKE